MVLPGLTQEKAFQHPNRSGYRFKLRGWNLEVNKYIRQFLVEWTCFQIMEKPLMKLLQVVDQALYAAKLHGRNCIKRV